MIEISTSFGSTFTSKQIFSCKNTILCCVWLSGIDFYVCTYVNLKNKNTIFFVDIQPYSCIYYYSKPRLKKNCIT